MKLVLNRRLLLWSGAIALVVVGIAAWRAGYLPTPGGGSADREREGKRLGNLSVPVSVTAARVDDVPVTIDAVGTVQALNTATIHTQVDGRLVKLPFSEGEDVKQGDIVALIEPNLYQAQYDQAVAKKAQDEATLANARIDLVRYQKLAAGNYGSQQQYTTQKYLVAQLEAQVNSDQALIDSAKTTLGYCTIRSPIDGRTGIRLVDVGNILHANDPLGILVVTQLKPIYVIFTIPQQALPAVQKAQDKGVSKVSALGPDNSTVIEVGQVSVIDNQIDQTTGTARIKATFANPHLHLWPGLFVNVRMVVDTVKHAIVVPSPAIQRGPSGAFVYLLDQGEGGDVGIARLKNVTTGQQDENIAVVTQGLEEGARVITSGFSRLSDGAKVRVAATNAAEGEIVERNLQGGPLQSPGATTLGGGERPIGGGGERRRNRDKWKGGPPGGPQSGDAPTSGAQGK